MRRGGVARVEGEKGGAREEERARAETAATPVTPVRPETAEVVSQFPIIQRLTREFARECPVPPQEYHASSRDDDTTTNPQRTQDYDPCLRPLPPSSPSTAYTTPTDSPEDDRTRGDSRLTDNATRNTDDVGKASCFMPLLSALVYAHPCCNASHSPHPA